MAQEEKALADHPSSDSQNPRGGREESVPQSCPLTATGVLWLRGRHAYVHVHIHMYTHTKQINT